MLCFSELLNPNRENRIVLLFQTHLHPFNYSELPKPGESLFLARFRSISITIVSRARDAINSHGELHGRSRSHRGLDKQRRKKARNRMEIIRATIDLPIAAA